MTEGTAVTPAPRDLVRPSLLAGALAFAGLPLYIHAPRYYADTMEVALPVLGVVLLAARGVDCLQDPLIGRLADRLPHRRGTWAPVAALLLVTGFALIFAPPGGADPIVRLGIGLVAAFTGFSALQIALYDHGLAQAEAACGGYTRVALWREVGGISGVLLAAIAPAALAPVLGPALSYMGYAALFAVLAAASVLAMAGRWMVSREGLGSDGFAAAAHVPGIRPLLAVGFVNALSTAVTATLFLFFVTDVLQAESQAGMMLLVFFASAAFAAPLWAQVAKLCGRKPTLMAGMALSIPAFAGAYALGPGDAMVFYAIAAASGMALGADMTLLPAMLAARIRGGGGRIFSLWTFQQKSALAIAAGVTLPLLAMAGFDPADVTDQGRLALATAYALVPCGLKLAALAACAALVNDEGDAA